MFKRVLELDFLGDGHAVVGDERSAEFLIQHDVAATRPQGDFNGIGQLVDTRLEGLAGVL